jgi:hypothetical protein
LEPVAAGRQANRMDAMPGPRGWRWWILGAVLLVGGLGAALWPESEWETSARAPEPSPALARVDAVEPLAPVAVIETPSVVEAGVVDAGAADAGPPVIDAGSALDAGHALDAGSTLDAGSLAELATLDAGAPPAPGKPEPAPGTDPRFGLRWSLPGHCGPGFERQMAARASLLATFTLTTLNGARFFADPGVDPQRVLAAGDFLNKARSISTGLLGAEAAVRAPDLYIYASAEALRSNSCVNQATAGYYDGAIHVSADDFDLEATITHELVHHVLNAMGVAKPMWLHEGLAMFAAQEHWWRDERLGLMKWLRNEHLPFEGLALAFPHSSDELFAGAVYYQSFRMVEFLFLSSPDRGGIYRLVAGLRSGSIQAQTAFAQSTGMSGEALEQSWKQFIQSR